MNTYVVLIRGINVGGKNRVPMADLKQGLKDLGYIDVETYINSGNVILNSTKNADEIGLEIESQLPKWFRLDSDLIKVLVVSKATLNDIVESKPAGFGDEPTKYHSDVIFLMDIDIDQAFAIFDPRSEVDYIWKGKGVVYSRRLSTKRTRSRLNKIMISPLYKSMTIRNWNTTMKLFRMVNEGSEPVASATSSSPR